MASLLELKQLSKQYGATLAVDHLDLTVQPGQIYAFLGPNGAGKTTTIRMMLGLVRPTSGQVWFQGQPLDGHPERVHAQVGSMVETPGFYPFLSGAENLHAFQRLHGNNDAARIKAVLELVDLASAGKKPVGAYSLGMKQRLGVALALLHRPQLLILDEPTNGLDPAGMSEVRNLLLRLKDEGFTIFLSSHLLHEVEQVASHVGIINNGKLVKEGLLSQVLNSSEAQLELQSSQADRLSKFLAAWLPQHVPGGSVRQDGNLVSVAGFTGDTEALNRAAQQADIPIGGIIHRQASLEQLFFQLTGAQQ
ncbi:MAG: ABC transporter ATP-binding protein [Candidatus Chloroheliales bacterium]|nr:MAG: ABC transporter ATP-binding protein [Chloroflexota bacterium]